LQAQQRDGSIPLGRWGHGAISTSFCTLFLVYGGAPVAVNKLQYGKGSDWNLNPRDLANLSKALWAAYERPINWQTVSINSPASEIEAPILFLSGSKAAAFTEKEMLKLREYVERGGTILAEPSDRSKDFAASMERLLKDMYPPKSYPNVKLEAIAADHPIYTVIKHDWKKRPKLRGASEAFASRLFGSHVTKTNALQSLVIASFIRGLPVRDVEATLAEALGDQAAIAKSTVSAICGQITGEYQA